MTESTGTAPRDDPALVEAVRLFNERAYYEATTLSKKSGPAPVECGAKS